MRFKLKIDLLNQCVRVVLAAVLLLESSLCSLNAQTRVAAPQDGTKCISPKIVSALNIEPLNLQYNALSYAHLPSVKSPPFHLDQQHMHLYVQADQCISTFKMHRSKALRILDGFFDVTQKTFWKAVFEGLGYGALGVMGSALLGTPAGWVAAGVLFGLLGVFLISQWRMFQKLARLDQYEQIGRQLFHDFISVGLGLGATYVLGPKVVPKLTAYFLEKFSWKNFPKLPLIWPNFLTPKTKFNLVSENKKYTPSQEDLRRSFYPAFETAGAPKDYFSPLSGTLVVTSKMKPFVRDHTLVKNLVREAHAGVEQKPQVLASQLKEGQPGNVFFKNEIENPDPYKIQKKDIKLNEAPKKSEDELFVEALGGMRSLEHLGVLRKKFEALCGNKEDPNYNFALCLRLERLIEITPSSEDGIKRYQETLDIMKIDVTDAFQTIPGVLYGPVLLEQEHRRVVGEDRFDADRSWYSLRYPMLKNFVMEFDDYIRILKLTPGVRSRQRLKDPVERDIFLKHLQKWIIRRFNRLKQMDWKILPKSKVVGSHFATNLRYFEAGVEELPLFFHVVAARYGVASSLLKFFDKDLGKGPVHIYVKDNLSQKVWVFNNEDEQIRTFSDYETGKEGVLYKMMDFIYYLPASTEHLVDPEIERRLKLVNSLQPTQD